MRVLLMMVCCKFIWARLLKNARDETALRESSIAAVVKVLVPGGGVEPPRAEARRILSPLRLPVPPSRLEILRQRI
jgi:hypothetical protein